MTTPSDSNSPQLFKRPSAARVYDYTLGGKDNFEVDRAATGFVISRFPEGLDVARHNRLFLYRAVRFLARDAGIRQYLDLGSGLPTQNNVHQVAQRFRPGARVVYVDNDPVVLTHGRALLATDPCTTVVAADMTETDKILVAPRSTGDSSRSSEPRRRASDCWSSEGSSERQRPPENTGDGRGARGRAGYGLVCVDHAVVRGDIA